MTNVSPTVTAPTLWNYAVCGQYPGAVGFGATVTMECTSDMLAYRYVIVQFQTSTAANFCELEVYIRRKFLNNASCLVLLPECLWPPHSQLFYAMLLFRMLSIPTSLFRLLVTLSAKYKCGILKSGLTEIICNSTMQKMLCEIGLIRPRSHRQTYLPPPAVEGFHNITLHPTASL